MGTSFSPATLPEQIGLSHRHVLPLRGRFGEDSKRTMSLLRKLLSTESEWNPKVMLGRILVRILPSPVLHRLIKHYYSYLITHSPENWIERDAEIVRELIRPGDRVLDIGASIGLFTRLLSRLVGPDGRVYSFEPIPQTYEYLENNIRKLRLSNVLAVQVALSETDGSKRMVIPTYRWGQECWYDARLEQPTSDPKWRRVEIQSRKLDTLNLDLAPVSFIKCDANYHELEVLQGGWQTTKRDKPAILIEVNPDPDDPHSTAFVVFNMLQELEYKAYWYDGTELRERQPGERSQNYFFLQR